MEFLLGLATGYLITWPAIVILIVLGIIFESSNSHISASFVGIVAAVSAYFFFHLDLQSLTAYIVAYFAIGFGWSVWRYRRHARTIVARHSGDSESARRYALQRLHPTAMLSTLTSWVLIWPFSMVENLAGDLVNLIQTTITRVFKSIYNRIYQAAVGDLMTPEELEKSR